MLEFFAIPLLLLVLLVEIYSMTSLAAIAVRFWRITGGVLMAILFLVALCLVTDSTAVRWLAGLFGFVALLAIGVLWEQKRGRLREVEKDEV